MHARLLDIRFTLPVITHARADWWISVPRAGSHRAHARLKWTLKDHACGPRTRARTRLMTMVIGPLLIRVLHDGRRQGARVSVRAPAACVSVMQAVTRLQKLHGGLFGARSCRALSEGVKSASQGRPQSKQTMQDWFQTRPASLQTRSATLVCVCVCIFFVVNVTVVGHLCVCVSM
jgi:hypothetical protein